MPFDLKQFVERTRDITVRDALVKGRGMDHLFRALVSETGEFAEALEVELGVKNKNIKESSKEEGVDVVICALAVYFSAGGSIEHLAEYGNKKLNKWDDAITEKINEQKNDKG